MELAFARLPVDVWVGVNHHKLNDLFGVVDGMNLTMLLSKFDYFVDGESSAYGLFKMKKNVTVSAGVKVQDTWVCFAGPGQTTNPLNRGVPFALIGDGQLPMLADTTDTAQARIVRLLARDSAAKRANPGPSPAKTPGVATDDDDLVTSGKKPPAWDKIARADLLICGTGSRPRSRP